MLKKKNIATIMAVATAASSVAPVFANTLAGTTVSMSDAEKMEQLRAELKELVELQYSTNAGDLNDTMLAGRRVHSVTIAKNGGISSPVTTFRDVEKAIASLSKENDYLTVSVTEAKGHSVVDEKVVDWKEGKYQTITDIQGITTNSYITKASSNGKVAELTLLNNDEPMYVSVGDVKLDFNSPIYKMDSEGNYLDKDGNKVAASSSNRVVIGFNKDKSVVATVKTYQPFTIKYAAQVSEEFEVTEMFNSMINRLTKKGNELAKYIRDYNANIDELEANGEMTSSQAAAARITITTSTATKSTIEVNIPKNLSRAAGDYATIVIRGAKTELDKLEAELTAALATNGKLNTLAGKDRIETSIEVSKEGFNKGTASNVVLVSDQVIADGLAATPFAKLINAPILLTNKDSISDEVLAEIERVMASNGKIYLVGGESVLTEKIEAQLEAKFFEFERIAGEDRQGTSLEIAKQMAKVSGNTMNEIFVTGGYAEADAMSIAAVAAKGGKTTGIDPILLAGANGLTEEQTKWMKFNAKNSPVYVVGGESHISAETEASLNDITTGVVKRLAGKGRQETNALVLDEFYGNSVVGSGGITNIFVAKSDNKGLVDALSAGVAAARTGAPVVLATDELDKTQEKVLSKLAPTGSSATINSAAKKKQVGYGIADKVWEAINSIF